jgi:hypothetical protein
MVSTQNAASARWPLPLQIVTAAILTPAESFLAAHVGVPAATVQKFTLAYCTQGQPVT